MVLLKLEVFFLDTLAPDMLFVSSFKKNSKELFFRLKLHRLVTPFGSVLLKLFYMGRQSKWIAEQKGKSEFNDFHSWKYEFLKMFDLFAYVSKRELSGVDIDY